MDLNLKKVDIRDELKRFPEKYLLGAATKPSEIRSCNAWRWKKGIYHMV